MNGTPPLAATLLAGRDPRAMLQAVLQAWASVHAHQAAGDLWLFGYASLIWRPEMPSLERRAVTVHGWHRALRMRSRINRGTPERPGLVFALVRGGSCRGMAYRIAGADVAREMPKLWEREMPTGVYDPRWLPCRAADGTVLRALAFTLSRSSPSHTGPMDEAQTVEVLRHAAGRYGSTWDYLKETAASLQACGIRDRGIEALMALARRHGLR